MAPSLNSVDQALVDAVPENGEIEYSELYQNLLASKNKASIGRYHDMRRAGTIQVRQQKDETGKLRSFISRPGYVRPEGDNG
jgi:hypothetical protein